MPKYRLAFVVMVFFVGNAWALESPISEKPLQVEFVLQSVYKHFPAIRASLKHLESQAEDVRSRQGAFDLRLRTQADLHTSGYYDGRALDMNVEKPFAFVGSEVYGGYRISDGQYALYEGGKNTLDDGELRAGVQFSLLRNRRIDANRADLWNSQLDQKVQEADYQQTLLMVHKQALKSYWQWVVSGHIYKVYESLLNIALDRETGLQKRVQSGDLAEIYLRENSQYILKRKTQMAHAQQKFTNASYGISIYARNHLGQPMIPTIEMLPPLPESFDSIDTQNLAGNIKSALHRYPKMRQLDYEKQKWKNQEQLGQNDLIPQLDVAWEISHDYGSGAPELDGLDSRAFISLEVPLERRLGKGKMRKAKLYAESITYQKQLQAEKLTTMIQTLWHQLHTQIQTIDYSKQEMLLAKELEKAENIRFANGDSDFFVVNMREQNTIQAKIQNMQEIMHYHFILAEYQALTVQLKKPVL